MFMRYEYLSEHPRVFRSMTGLAVSEFDELAIDVKPFYETTEQERLARPDRVRAPGGGHPFELDYRDSLLLATIWLRQYPVGEVLGYFFGVSEPTARRTVKRMLPALEAAGRVGQSPLSAQHFEQVALVPTSFQTFVFDATLGRFLLLEQIQSDVS